MFRFCWRISEIGQLKLAYWGKPLQNALSLSQFYSDCFLTLYANDTVLPSNVEVTMDYFGVDVTEQRQQGYLRGSLKFWFVLTEM